MKNNPQWLYNDDVARTIIGDQWGDVATAWSLATALETAMRDTTKYLVAADAKGGLSQIHPHTVAGLLLDWIERVGVTDAVTTATASEILRRKPMVYVAGEWRLLADLRAPAVTHEAPEREPLVKPTMPEVALHCDARRSGWDTGGAQHASMVGWTRELVAVAPRLFAKPLYQQARLGVERRAVATLLALVADTLSSLPDGVTVSDVLTYCGDAIQAMAQTPGGNVALGSYTDTKRMIQSEPLVINDEE